MLDKGGTGIEGMRKGLWCRAEGEVYEGCDIKSDKQTTEEMEQRMKKD